MTFASSLELNSFSTNANLLSAEFTLERAKANSTRRIHASIFVLSNGGRSGRRKAWTWLVWLESAAATAASVAMRDCLSLSSRSCCNAIFTALAHMRSMAASSMVVASVCGAVETGKVKFVDEGVGDGLGDGDLEREMRLRRS